MTIRIWRRVLARLTHDPRQLFHPNRWPLNWRVRIGRATSDEISALERQRSIEAYEKDVADRLDDLARTYKHLLIQSLTKMGVTYKTVTDGRARFSKIKFHKPANVTLEAIYFQVKTTELPFLVKIFQLYKDEVLETLAASTGKPVNFFWDRHQPDKGFWFIVELKAGVRGIPRKVEYNDMLTDLPSDAPPLTVPIGCGLAGAKKYIDLGDGSSPHLLVGGATGQGKSVFVKEIVTTLALRNKANRVKMILVDLKRTELGAFAHLPHLLMPVVKDNEGVVPVLERAVRELKARAVMLDKKNVTDIKQWNRTHFQKLEYWIIVIDEIANLMLNPAIKDDVDRLLDILAAQGRFAGIHLIICTQRPEARVVTGLIKANFTARVAFACSDQMSSKVILDTTDAYGIGPQGRMIFFTGKEKLELQGPYIDQDIVVETANAIAGGNQTEVLDRRKRHNFSEIDFFRHSLIRYEGAFSPKVMYEDFKAQGVTRYELEKLVKEYSNQELEIDDAVYKLIPAVSEGMKQPARLLKIRDAVEDANSDAEPMPAPLLDEFQPILFPLKKPMPIMTDASETSEDSSPSENELVETQ